MNALWVPRDGSPPTLTASPDADVIAPDDEIDGVALRDLLARGGETPAQRAVVAAYRAAAGMRGGWQRLVDGVWQDCNVRGDRSDGSPWPPGSALGTLRYMLVVETPRDAGNFKIGMRPE